MDQSCRFQDPNVLGDGVEGPGEPTRKVGHPDLALGQVLQNFSPGGVRQGAEGGIEAEPSQKAHIQPFS
jgi:hypothetical protein